MVVGKSVSRDVETSRNCRNGILGEASILSKCCNNFIVGLIGVHEKKRSNDNSCHRVRYLWIYSNLFET